MQDQTGHRSFRENPLQPDRVSCALFNRGSVLEIRANQGPEGFAIDLVSGTFQLGEPSLAASTLPLFRSEYHVPLISPEVAAHMAAFAEHFFPVLILAGFATRFSALALIGMTLVIQLFVYPDAYPTHGTWLAAAVATGCQGPGSLVHRPLDRPPLRLKTVQRLAAALEPLHQVIGQNLGAPGRPP